MDLNIEPLLNMTFDENGINEFFTLYQNKLEQDLNALNLALNVKEQINANENLLLFEDYAKINEEIQIYTKLLDLNQIYENFQKLKSHFENKIDVITKDIDLIKHSLKKAIQINQNIYDFIDGITQTVLMQLEDTNISDFSSSYQATFKTFSKEMLEKIYLTLTSLAEKNFLPFNIEAMSFIQQKTNLPLIKLSFVLKIYCFKL